MTAPLTIVFPIYPGLTQLDFTGSHQFLSQIPGAEVVVASAAGGTIPAGGGLAFADTRRLAGVTECDVLCVPGGSPATEVALDSSFLPEVRRLGRGARYVTSVCTGSLILAAAGLLKGRRAACHWQWRHLRPLFDAIPAFAQSLQLGFEYAPAPPFSSGSPETAPADIIAVVKESAARQAVIRDDQVREAVARLRAEAPPEPESLSR